MILASRAVARQSLALIRARFYGKQVKLQGEWDSDLDSTSASKTTTLPFNHTRHSEAFGQLVRSDKHKDVIQYSGVVHNDTISPFRDEEGNLLKGSNSEEARLDDSTLLARVDRSVCRLPPSISNVIQYNILRFAVPDKLRERSATVFQSIEKDQIQKAPDNSINADAFIASLFIQNYSHAHQVLLELQKRVGKENFNPQNILDIGYGPATGIVALNEIMGPDWVPNEKEAYVVGRKNTQMKKRAKIILSRQLNENFSEVEIENEEGTEKATESSEGAFEAKTSEINNADNTKEVKQSEETLVNEELNEAALVDELEETVEFDTEEHEGVEFEENDGEHVGPIDTARIKIRTKLRDNLPVTKKYDLIMLNQSLLTREYNFPTDIDVNLRNVLRLLKPEGHLVIIERGNTLGFETVARARQLILRPESYTGEVGKIPRPYIKGSTRKPQRELRKDDQILTEIDRFEEDIIAKYGDPTVEDLRFEFEGDENYELLTVEEAAKLKDDLNPESVDYHLKVIAPCSHHTSCPLQLGDPRFYKTSAHKHRLNFCAFTKTVERPKFTMELKKGRRLATPWDKTAEDGMGLDNIKRNVLKSLGGTGRPGGKNTEQGSYSYLIVQRSKNDNESIKKIDEDRKNNVFKDGDVHDYWPRIIQTPTKIKNNVKLNVCSPDGNSEIWTVPKSIGRQAYHDARKAELGDLWSLSKKSVVVRKKLSDEAILKIKNLAKSQKKSMERNRNLKKKTNFQEKDIGSIADEVATSFENSKLYKKKGKKMKLDVNLEDYDGK